MWLYYHPSGCKNIIFLTPTYWICFNQDVMWRQFVILKEILTANEGHVIFRYQYFWIINPLSRIKYDVDYIIYYSQYYNSYDDSGL